MIIIHNCRIQYNILPSFASLSTLLNLDRIGYYILSRVFITSGATFPESEAFCLCINFQKDMWHLNAWSIQLFLTVIWVPFILLTDIGKQLPLLLMRYKRNNMRS